MIPSRTESAGRYLDELARLTSGLPADARNELLESIEEHLAESEARGDLEGALVRLGPPEQIAEAARLDSPRNADEPSGRWLVWLTAAMAGATIAGFSILGALLSVTARFDEDADWSIHPALALFAASAGALAGLFATIAAAPARGWRLRDKFLLTALWLSAAALAIGGQELALLLPLGAGFALAGLQLLLGGLGTLAALALAVRATGRSRRSSVG